MKRYDYLIFDADHTVIDFDEDECRAFRATFEAVGIPYTPEMVEQAWQFSADNWKELGLYNVHTPEIQRTFHEGYHRHVSCIVAWLNEQFGLKGKEQLARQTFEQTLALPAHYIDRADELIQELSKEYKVCIATNGLAFLQWGRLSAVLPYLHKVFISEEMGIIKPAPEFFNQVLTTLQTTPDRCLMIGDSVSSDMVGANVAEIPAVWYNPKGREKPDHVRILAKITNLWQLKELL